MKSGYVLGPKDISIVSPKLREDEGDKTNYSSKRKNSNRKDEDVYSNRYQSESQKAYNEKANVIISPIQPQNNKTDRSIRNVATIQDDHLKITGMTSNNDTEGIHGNQIYTFREQNKNEEFFKNKKVDHNEIDDSDFVSGYFSPEENSIDTRQTKKNNGKLMKKILIQKNLNFKGSFQKGKFLKLKND